MCFCFLVYYCCLLYDKKKIFIFNDFMLFRVSSSSNNIRLLYIEWIDLSVKVQNRRHSNIDNAFWRNLLGWHQHIYFNPMCWEESWHVCSCTVITKWNKWKGLFDISVLSCALYALLYFCGFLWINRMIQKYWQDNLFLYYNTKEYKKMHTNIRMAITNMHTW